MEESSIDKTMKAADNADKMEPSPSPSPSPSLSLQQMTNEVEAMMSDPERRANFWAFIEECRIAEERATGKRKSKTVMRRLTQKHIDAILALPVGTWPLPCWSEERLARVADKDIRDRIRDQQAAAAAVVRKVREEERLEKERILEELRTKGYVEREFYVTDDEDEDDGKGADDDEGSGDI